MSSEEYEVSISCQNLANKDLLSKSDPVAILLAGVPHTKRFVELGRTEMIKDCLDPRFVKKFRLIKNEGDHDPQLRVALVDIDEFDDPERLAEQDFIGRADFHQSQLTENPVFSVALSENSGRVTFRTVRYDPSLDGQVTLELANHSFPLKDRPAFLEIHRAEGGNQSECEDQSSFTLAYRSEQSITGEFQPIKVSLFTLALGERDRSLRLELWLRHHNGEHVRVGKRNTCLEELERIYVYENVPHLHLDYKEKNGRSCSLVIKYFDLRQH